MSNSTADGISCIHSQTSAHWVEGANARTEGNDHRGCGTRLHIEPQLGVLWRDDLEEGLRESTEKLQGVRQLSALVS